MHGSSAYSCSRAASSTIALNRWRVPSSAPRIARIAQASAIERPLLWPLSAGLSSERLAKEPSGETRTYADVAVQVDHPKAVRAVGAANGANPIPIIIPCHRVIGSDGSLTGFGGGLDTKQWLLDPERSRSGLFGEKS